MALTQIRRRIGAVIAAFLVAASGVASAATSAWRVYENSRWGFRIDVPKSLIAQEEPDNLGGLAFYSKDGRVRLETYAGYDYGGVTEVNELQKSFEEQLTGPKGKITYRSIGSSWFVLSGTTGDGRIFYQRYEQRHVGDERCYIAFDISYPKTMRATWNANTTRIAKSFKVPPGNCQG